MDSISLLHASQSNAINKPLWLLKLTRFEFWPYWVLYFPVLVYYLWLSIKARSITFFTAANPALYLGGLVGEQKHDILKKLPEQYLPNTIFIARHTPFTHIQQLLQEAGITFPCVAKPNVGERGFAVEVMHNKEDLLLYTNQYHHDFLIQPFIDLPIEAGVLCYRMPGGNTRISSIVLKSYLAVTGNGNDSLETLIYQNIRARLRLNYLLHKFSGRLKYIPDKGEQILLEPIGNHCRGTTFLSGQHLITPATEVAFDKLMQQIDGVYIGRFDVKAESLQHLKEGRITVLELNGVASEPAHIYDPNCSLREAYRALFFHYHTIYNIAQANHQIGAQYAKTRTLFHQLWHHFTH